jgi:hypothetical protein
MQLRPSSLETDKASAAISPSRIVKRTFVEMAPKPLHFALLVKLIGLGEPKEDSVLVHSLSELRSDGLSAVVSCQGQRWVCADGRFNAFALNSVISSKRI